MRERPINFDDFSVRAVQTKRKTQFRRPVKTSQFSEAFRQRALHVGVARALDELPELPCPHGKVGDHLWVRECWGLTDIAGWYRGSVRDANPSDYQVVRRAWHLFGSPGWRSSTQMPRWASQITLEITDIHVERLRSMSNDDLFEEGYPSTADGLQYFIDRWDAKYKASSQGLNSWDSNPWVWAVSFKLL